MNMTRIQISAQKKPFLRIRVVQTRTWPRGELLEVVRQRLATCGWDGARGMAPWVRGQARELPGPFGLQDSLNVGLSWT